MRRNASSPSLSRRGSSLTTPGSKDSSKRRIDSRSITDQTSAKNQSVHQGSTATSALTDRPSSVAFIETPTIVVDDGNREEKSAAVDALYQERKRESKLDELSFDNAAFLERIAGHRRALNRSEEEFLQFSSDVEGGGRHYSSPGGKRRTSGTSPLRTRAPQNFSPANRGPAGKPPLSSSAAPRVVLPDKHAGVRSQQLAPPSSERLNRNDGIPTGMSAAQAMLSTEEVIGAPSQHRNFAGSTKVKREDLALSSGNPHHQPDPQSTTSSGQKSYQNSLSGSDSETAVLKSLEAGLKGKKGTSSSVNDPGDRLKAAQDRLRRAQEKQNEVLEHMARKDKRREMKKLGSAYAPSNFSGSDSDGSVAPSLFSVSSRKTTAKGSGSSSVVGIPTGSSNLKTKHAGVVKNQTPSLLKRSSSGNNRSQAQNRSHTGRQEVDEDGSHRSTPDDTQSTISRVSTLHNLARKESILLNPQGNSTIPGQRALEKNQQMRQSSADQQNAAPNSSSNRYFDGGNLSFLHGGHPNDATTTAAQQVNTMSTPIAKQNTERRMAAYLSTSGGTSRNQALGDLSRLMESSQGPAASPDTECLDPALAITAVRAPRLLGDVSQFLMTPSLTLAEEEAYYLTPVLRDPVGKPPPHVLEQQAKERAARDNESEVFKQKTKEQRSKMLAKEGSELRSPPKWLDLDNVKFSSDFHFDSSSAAPGRSSVAEATTTSTAVTPTNAKGLDQAAGSQLSDSPVFSGSPSENLKWTMAFMLQASSVGESGGDGSTHHGAKPSQLMDDIHYVQARASFSGDTAGVPSLRNVSGGGDGGSSNLSLTGLKRQHEASSSTDPLHRRLMETPLTPRR